MPEEKHLVKLKAFLCYCTSDRDDVRALYARLNADGVDAWFDKEKLSPGRNVEFEVSKAVRESDVVIICLSNQFPYPGAWHRDLKTALKAASFQPEGEVFIIPAQLEQCEIPKRLEKFDCANLFEESGYRRLLQSLQLKAEKLGCSSVKTLPPPEPKPELPTTGESVQINFIFVINGNEDIETVKTSIKGLYAHRDF
jgi:hypothetical protein